MNLLEELEFLLPTRGAKWTALLTITLLPFAFSAPRSLQPLLAPKATDAEIVVAQILLPTLIALFGALITFLLIIVHLRNEEKTRRVLLKELNDAYQKNAPLIKRQREENTSKPKP